MNKIENYLGIANHDIQVANNSDELKSYVASILCEIDELQQENKKLNGAIQTYDILLKANVEENKQLKDNWNKLKEIAKSQSGFKKQVDLKGGLWFEIDDLLDKMQELEQGSDE